MWNSIYDKEIRTVEKESRALQWAIQCNNIYNKNNPEGRPPTDDEEEAYRLLSLVQFRYNTGDCAMIKDEDNRRRWRHVKIIQSFGWWLFGGFTPIYIISFGDGQVQNCIEEELFFVSEVLECGKPSVTKGPPTGKQRRSKKPMDTRTVNQSSLSDLKDIAFTESFAECFCAAGQCVHSPGYQPEEGEIIEVF